MAGQIDHGALIRKPLLLGLAIIVIRLGVELAGASTLVASIFGVAWLHIFVPIYFAIELHKAGVEKPFAEMLKVTAKFTLLLRIPVAITYALAYQFNWNALRFSTEALGPVGDNVSAMQGLLLFPVLNYVSWIVLALVLAAITGGLTLMMRNRSARQVAT